MKIIFFSKKSDSWYNLDQMALDVAFNFQIAMILSGVIKPTIAPAVVQQLLMRPLPVPIVEALAILIGSKTQHDYNLFWKWPHIFSSLVGNLDDMVCSMKLERELCG